ncbi:MAG: hypothetical protein UX13_C0006G0008 [Candidatus Woesebacteria bacterium GW2011_GWB1_45_5]|uniref:Uncharacterized protein n=1 Tax=Candidatus Woesebacteria bacterium GW2011_GWB1_45_5 TaxID=1618581 RepID=A0A0G1MRB7_9BACT|nr:MAG: hypothetical protein UX13_C0006G0008 [Candidatus Woesebacteria bacterium GW2011_GWB1_45_5]
MPKKRVKKKGRIRKGGVFTRRINLARKKQRLKRLTRQQMSDLEALQFDPSLDYGPRGGFVGGTEEKSRGKGNHSRQKGAFLLKKRR